MNGFALSIPALQASGRAIGGGNVIPKNRQLRHTKLYAVFPNCAFLPAFGFGQTRNIPKSYPLNGETMTNEITKSPDSNVEKNREALLQRSIAGLAKYGVTTDNNPLTLRAWLQHALEEALDMANYLQAVISKLDEEGANHDNANRQ